MAFENLFIRTKRSIAGVQLDAMISEAHDNSVRLTKHPIEKGADITDHAVVEPKRITLNGVVSDSPLGLAAFAQIIDNITGLFGSATSDNLTRSQAAYNTLLQAQESRVPLTVQTKLKLYENMLITKIRTVQDKDTSRIVDMIIDLDEALITETQVVEFQADQLQLGKITEQASPEVKRGKQEPTAPTETTETSVLKTASDWLGVTQ